MAETEYKIGLCGLCGSQCAISTMVKDNKIQSVERLEAHPYLSSDICVRGAALKQYVHHPDRLTHPMKRVGDGYIEISWEQAISEIADRLRKTKEESGAKSTVFYSGHPKWYRRVLADLAAGYGSPNFCSESSTCNSAMQIAWGLLCGNSTMFPDMKNTRTHVIWANNLAGAKGDATSIIALKKRGIKLIVADPRKTPEADMADVHLQLRAGTDGALALGIANVIISQNLQNQEYIDQYTIGFEEYKKYVSEFTLERTSQITGVPAELIEKAALIMAEGKISIKCTSCAVVHAINGVQNFRAVALLAVLTGSLGLEGGNRPLSMPKASLNDFHHNLTKRPDIQDDLTGDRFPIWEEIVNNEAQCEGIADIILNEKPYKVRNFIGFGVNLDMWPRSDKMTEAFSQLEFKVVVDLFWTAAAKMADYVLPAAMYPERHHVVVGKGNHLVFVKPVIDPGDKLPDVEIMLRLAHKLDVHGELNDLKDYFAYLDYIMKETGISLNELMASPDGLDARTLTPGRPFDISKGVNTPSGKLEFMSTRLERYADREGYEALPVFHDFRETVGDMEKFPYILTTGARKAYYFHSRTFKIPWISNLETHPNVKLCPADAEKIGVNEGDKVKVSTPVGSWEFFAEIDAGLLPGSVYIYHEPGENCINRLIDDHYTDPISGFPGYRSYICHVGKA